MKSIKAKKDFTLNNVDYFVGEEIKINNISDIIKLNEKIIFVCLNIGIYFPFG